MSVKGKDITPCKFLKLETEFCVKTSDVWSEGHSSAAMSQQRGQHAPRCSFWPGGPLCLLCGVNISSSLAKVAFGTQRAAELLWAKSQGG